MKMSREFWLPVEHTDICQVEGADGEWDMEAVAAIVHAVNNHDKLVEALKGIRDDSSGGPEARSMADNALMELEDE